MAEKLQVIRQLFRIFGVRLLEVMCVHFFKGDKEVVVFLEVVSEL